MDKDRPAANASTEAASPLPRCNFLKFVLGSLQMVGASASFFLLLALGVTEAVIWVFAATTLVSLLSVLLFRVLKIQERRPATH